MTAVHSRSILLPISTTLMAAFLFQGCALFDDYYYDRGEDLQAQQNRIQMQQHVQTINKQTTNVNKQLAAMRADLRAFQESQRQLVGVIDELRQENHQRAKEIEQLRSLVASLESRVAKSDGKWRTDMNRFKSTLAKDQQQAMTKLTSNLAQEIERNMAQIRKAQAAQRATAAARTSSYGQYTVQAGDTLGAIAKAFRVSVKSLREANGLKSDIIRVGQTLKIPSP